MATGSNLKDIILSKKTLINVVLIAVVYVAAMFITKWYLGGYTNHGEKIAVPDLVSKTETQIGSIVSDLGLAYEVSETVYDPTKPEGTILEQDPMPSKNTNLFVKEGRIIRIKISKKTQLVEIPNCIDKSQRFAENILKSRGLKYKIEYKPSVESNGAVINQTYNGRKIGEKEKIAIGSTITLVVGKSGIGENIPTPNLLDLTICDVKSRLSVVSNVNLVIMCNNCYTSEDTCSAVVFSQSPEYYEGSMIGSGSTLTVHASKQ